MIQALSPEVVVAKVSAKGQVTLPKNVREANDISSGDEVDFLSYGNEITIIKKRNDASRGVTARFKLNPIQAIADGRFINLAARFAPYTDKNNE